MNCAYLSERTLWLGATSRGEREGAGAKYYFAYTWETFFFFTGVWCQSIDNIDLYYRSYETGSLFNLPKFPISEHIDLNMHLVL